jgi:hypothetical protein
MNNGEKKRKKDPRETSLNAQAWVDARKMAKTLKVLERKGIENFRGYSTVFNFLMDALIQSDLEVVDFCDTTEEAAEYLLRKGFGIGSIRRGSSLEAMGKEAMEAEKLAGIYGLAGQPADIEALTKSFDREKVIKGIYKWVDLGQSAEVIALDVGAQLKDAGINQADDEEEAGWLFMDQNGIDLRGVLALAKEMKEQPPLEDSDQPPQPPQLKDDDGREPTSFEDLKSIMQVRTFSSPVEREQYRSEWESKFIRAREKAYEEAHERY